MLVRRADDFYNLEKEGNRLGFNTSVVSTLNQMEALEKYIEQQKIAGANVDSNWINNLREAGLTDDEARKAIKQINDGVGPYYNKFTFYDEVKKSMTDLKERYNLKKTKIEGDIVTLKNDIDIMSKEINEFFQYMKDLPSGHRQSFYHNWLAMALNNLYDEGSWNDAEKVINDSVAGNRHCYYIDGMQIDSGYVLNSHLTTEGHPSMGHLSDPKTVFDRIKDRFIELKNLKTHLTEKTDKLYAIKTNGIAKKVKIEYLDKDGSADKAKMQIVTKTETTEDGSLNLVCEWLCDVANDLKPEMIDNCQQFKIGHRDEPVNYELKKAVIQRMPINHGVADFDNLSLEVYSKKSKKSKSFKKRSSSKQVSGKTIFTGNRGDERQQNSAYEVGHRLRKKCYDCTYSSGNVWRRNNTDAECPKR